ncbi:Polysaccharide export outer membrane protein [hydrothermal vent metagenome]|uniref:Polysaccharide export outer membrane protein n=1 Tax=hydrothermal vent metagenome TaxID=652676 RepID=A0A3B0V1X0_9ZZZZ
MQMKNIFFKYLTILSVVFTITSCVSTKKIVYFQDDDGVIGNETVVAFEPKIQVGDMLRIYVSAIDTEAATPFNLYESSGATSTKLLTYLVDIDGNINFPVLGKIKVAGFTNKQITNNLSQLLGSYIKNPVVNVRLINFKVTVLGEVNSPGTYTVPNERISILGAIGLAGDLSIQGKRKTVVIVREEEGKRKLITLDLSSKKILSSPYFYLAQNDVIYVEPNKAKINSSAVGANAGIIISSISTVISLIAILTR